MKYIRTKNEIIYVGDLIKDEYGNYCDPKNYETDMEVPKEYIIKEADTIEELCDGFIFKDTCTNKLHLADLNDGISMLGVALFEETLRGFIETDKGLIYVAKMNEKGELELI